MKLSANFTLEEFERSQTALRAGRPNRVPAHLLPNAVHLATTILQPLRDALMMPVNISSGYRGAWLNREVRGSASSQHVLALAADINVPGLTPLELCERIDRLGLPYDQTIHEMGAWCHVSAAEPGREPRRQKLTIGWRKNQVVTLAGFLPVEHGVIV